MQAAFQRMIWEKRSAGAGAGARARARAWARAWAGARAVTMPESDAACMLLAGVNDPFAFCVLGDLLADKGINMHEFEVGTTYFIETMTWYYVGTVVEVTPLSVRLEPACRIHWLNDTERFLRTGEFSSGDEAFPLPHGERLPALWIGPSSPHPHPVPTKRTHAEA